MASNASLNALRHAYAEKGNQVCLIRRHRMSIRFNSGEYGGRYLMTNPCFFQYGIRSSNSSLVWIDALSMTTTVFFVIVRQKASKHAITTPVWMDSSNINGCKSLWRFINPSTFEFIPIKSSVAKGLGA